MHEKDCGTKRQHFVPQPFYDPKELGVTSNTTDMRAPRKHLVAQAFVCLYAPPDFLNALRLNERSPAGRTAQAVNVIQSHFTNARVLGTFSHTTCYPISFVLQTSFLDRSVFPH